VLALFLVSIFTFFGSWLLYKFVDIVIPMRVRYDQEDRGLDISQHGEQML